ncbi:MAG TPA: PepSY-associated TM helix domain-containing protein [Beijerinckiaceae bacterium]|nr:PepSY-associated TM helix domain-containing protein [Beijerinckiaceae bacterium]
MLKAWFLKLHGWIALIFSVPLAILCVTGLVLGFEPIVQYSTIEPGTLNAEEIIRYLDRHDPQGKTTSIVHRPYENTLTLGGVGPEGELEIDLVTRDVTTSDGGAWDWSEIFRYNRRLHEHVSVAGLELTVAATIAMCVIILLGVLLGLPVLRNSVAGWHKAIAWFGLPFLIISPLTGLFIAWGVSMNIAPAPTPERSAPLPIREAVQIAGTSHDLSNLVWLRQRGGRQMIRLWDGQEARSYAIARSGLVPMPRNVSRMIHEGNFLGIWSGILKVLTGVAFVVLMVTGLWLFIRKQVRKARNRQARRNEAAGSAAS